MANIQSRRRPALIPDSVSLSPEEAEDVLRRCAGSISPYGSTDSQSPWFENPFKPSKSASTEEICNESQVNGKQSRRHRIGHQGGDLVWHTDDLHGKRSLQIACKSTRRDKFKKLNGHDTHLRHPMQLPLESSSVDGPFAKDERRRYSVEILENIPHVSEILSETRVGHSGFVTPNSYDIYGVGTTLGSDKAWQPTYQNVTSSPIYSVSPGDLSSPKHGFF